MRYLKHAILMALAIVMLIVFSPASFIGQAGATVIGGRPAGCPHQYCGCAVARKVGLSGAKWNLAANYLTLPRTSCAPGMVAARRGHVFVIQSCHGNGSVTAYDPNSGGGKTRIHTRSLRGYAVVNPRGGGGASSAYAWWKPSPNHYIPRSQYRQRQYRQRHAQPRRYSHRHRYVAPRQHRVRYARAHR